MTEENIEPTVGDFSNQITRGEVRSRYPWASLTEVDSHFIIPADNKAGVDNVRQLCYAANKAQERKESAVRFRYSKNADGSVMVRRIS